MAFGRESAFLADLLQSIADRSRRLLGRDVRAQRLRLPTRPNSPRACSPVRERPRALRSREQRRRAYGKRWTRAAASTGSARSPPISGRKRSASDAAVAAWQAAPAPDAAAELHDAAEPLRQELFRRINLAPGGTATLVAMRAALLAELPAHPELAPVEADFVHLLSSWFNRGFLFLRRIDWSSPADVLEKIIRYEAVHEIDGFEDLRLRLAPPDRRCFAFFHPQMPDDPLIFVEIALTRGVPTSIDGAPRRRSRALDGRRRRHCGLLFDLQHPAGLRGDLLRQLPDQAGGRRTASRPARTSSTFVTLSPVPGFARWLNDGTDRRACSPRLTAAIVSPPSTTTPGISTTMSARRSARSSPGRRDLPRFDAKGRERQAARSRRPFSSRQRREPRSHQPLRRPLPARARTILRRHGQLPLRPGVDREEPRGLRRSGKVACLAGGSPARGTRPRRGHDAPVEVERTARSVGSSRARTGPGPDDVGTLHAA